MIPSKKKMKPVHLYPTERALLEKLPDDIRKEFTILDETLDFTDSPQKLGTRLSLVRLHDPKLLTFRKDVESGMNIVEASKKANLKDVDEGDLSELFFAMGPSLLTSFITGLLSSAKTDTDFLSIGALADIRHTLLTAFNPR